MVGPREEYHNPNESGNLDEPRIQNDIYIMKKVSIEVSGLTIEEFNEYKRDGRLPHREVEVIELLQGDTLERFNEADEYIGIWGREGNEFFTAKILTGQNSGKLCQLFYDEIEGEGKLEAEKFFEKVKVKAPNGGRRSKKQKTQKTQKKQKKAQKKQKKQKTRRL